MGIWDMVTAPRGCSRPKTGAEGTRVPVITDGRFSTARAQGALRFKARRLQSASKSALPSASSAEVVGSYSFEDDNFSGPNRCFGWAPFVLIDCRLQGHLPTVCLFLQATHPFYSLWLQSFVNSRCPDKLRTGGQRSGRSQRNHCEVALIESGVQLVEQFRTRTGRNTGQ